MFPCEVLDFTTEDLRPPLGDRGHLGVDLDDKDLLHLSNAQQRTATQGAMEIAIQVPIGPGPASDRSPSRIFQHVPYGRPVTAAANQYTAAGAGKHGHVGEVFVVDVLVALLKCPLGGICGNMWRHR